MKIDLELEKILKALTPREAEIIFSQLEGYEETPVNIEEFILDPYFLGETFRTTGFYSFWMQKLKQLYPHALIPSRYYECIVTGSIGTGKTVFSLVCTLYSIYRLLLLDSPQKRFNLIGSVDIRFALFNSTMDLAYDVLWTTLNNMMSDSPFFKHINIADEKRKVEIVLPKRIGLTLASQVKHTLGKAIFGGVLDETNFSSSISTGNKRVYEVYSSWLRRMESRFLKEGGIIPGQLFLVSSKRDESDFLDAHIENLKKVQSKGRVQSSMVIDSCIWEVKQDVVNPTTGQKIYSGVTFPVFLGSQAEPPIIIEPQDLPRYNENMILQVPVEHRDAFEKNITDAIRDIAGISTTSKFKFFVNSDLLKAAFKIVHVSRNENIKLTFDDDDEVMDYINKDVLLTYLHKNPTSKRVVHLDVGLSGDAFGLAMGCISGLKVISKSNEFLEEDAVQVVEPNIVIELAIGIVRGGSFQVPLFKIRQFILDLVDLGFPIGMITADSYQSTDTLQLLKRLNFNTKEVSVDRTKGPYNSLKNAVYEGRIQMPNNPVLMREMSMLRETQKKVEHLEGTECLHPDTKICLLDGTNPTIKELADNYNPNEPIYLYTIGKEGVTVGVGVNPRVTRKNAETLIIVLDNKEEVCCTPDHRFMMRDGTYREAKDLIVDDSLMPLELKKNGRGYIAYLDPIKKRNCYTHKMVIDSVPVLRRLRAKGGYEVHHKADKLNNDPRQLVLLPSEKHKELHENIDTETFREVLNTSNNFNEVCKKLKITKRILKKLMVEAKILYNKHYYRTLRRAAISKNYKNHKVIEIKQGPITDTYDISVPGTENFAVSSGCFLHNSKDVSDCCSAITYTLLELYHTQAFEYFADSGIDSVSRKMNKYEGIPRELLDDDYGLTEFEGRFGVDLTHVASQLSQASDM